MAKALLRVKRQLTVYISEDLYSLLIEMAPNLYGRVHGALSAVVEEALREYLLPRAHTRSTPNPRLGIRSIYDRVIGRVQEILNLPFRPSEVPEKVLDMAIAETRGGTPRTVERWKAQFLRFGLIKFIGGSPPNRIVELL
jgi:hypothetical protein